MSESDWTDWVVETATLHGWRVTHFRPARTARGWRTAVQGHKGFFDLVLARNGVVLIVELKTDAGRLTPDQRQWFTALGELAAVWRPRDRDQVLATLAASQQARNLAGGVP
ncbi:hypothetical protein K1T35_47970 (plasmid) [Pseudonocardia sp. DSM 110487]|uniref:hypothetical protein n=1 Tax=Pseudonocardia sp. DSM 110487 TaxID=2865833 RepID=UPI001C697425|nr:hypothetical protein [Pseudonocardia sp. DSM 110487]QYN41089.1 hypothetical protein K1T35_47970 [Pseudonocardia sp. DSM 110487]